MATDRDLKNLSHAQEETPEELEQLKEWWAAHGNVVTVALVALLVAVVGARWWKARATSRAEAAMTALQQADSPDALERIVEQDVSAPATALARLRLGAAQYAAGKYDLAKAAYAEFLAASPRHELAAVAAFGLAQSEEALGDVAAATRLFREFGDKHASSALAPLATIGLARNLILSGGDEEAREGRSILDLFLAEHAGEPWAASADELIRASKRLKLPAAAVASSDIASFLSAAAPAAEEAAEAEAEAEAAEAAVAEAVVATAGDPAATEAVVEAVEEAVAAEAAAETAAEAAAEAAAPAAE